MITKRKKKKNIQEFENIKIVKKTKILKTVKSQGTIEARNIYIYKISKYVKHPKYNIRYLIIFMSTKVLLFNDSRKCEFQ